MKICCIFHVVVHHKSGRYMYQHFCHHGRRFRFSQHRVLLIAPKAWTHGCYYYPEWKINVVIISCCCFNLIILNAFDERERERETLQSPSRRWWRKLRTLLIDYREHELDDLVASIPHKIYQPEKTSICSPQCFIGCSGNSSNIIDSSL